MVSLHVYANVNIVGGATVDVPKDEIAALYHVRASQTVSLTRDETLLRHNATNYILTTKRRTAQYSYAPQYSSPNYEDDDDMDDMMDYFEMSGGGGTVISLTDTDDPSVVDGTGSLRKGLTAWIDKNLKNKKVTLHGEQYLINACSLAPKYVEPFGYQVVDQLKIDMYPRNGYETYIPPLLNGGDLQNYLGRILTTVVLVEFALHMAYIQSLLHIVVNIADINEVLDGMDEMKYHMDMTRSRGSHITQVPLLKGVLGMFGSVSSSFNTAVSKTIADHQKYKKIDTAALNAPYALAVKHTASAFDLALATCVGTLAHECNGDATTVSRCKQLREFMVQLDNLAKQISEMVRPGKLGFDSYGTLQRIRTAFEILFSIVKGLQLVDLNPIANQRTSEVVELLTAFKNHSKN
jgi:hypothetical protein